MKRVLKYIAGLVLVLAGMVGFSVSAFAGSYNLNYKVVIDNYSSYPSECDAIAGGGYWYRIYLGTQKTNQYVAGITAVDNGFGGHLNIENGLTSTLPMTAETSGADVITVVPSESTSRNISLVGLEYTAADNLQPYTVYLPGGSTASDCMAQIINKSNPTINLTLHFKYNPDIPPLTYTVNEPAYKKTVDYLGDGVLNIDTLKTGENDYRLYLDVTTAALEDGTNNDIVLVLDDSGSMKWNTSDGHAKVSVLRNTMNDFIDIVTQNPKNRVSIIKFGYYSQVLISKSNSAAALKGAIATFNGGQGATNYYQSLLQAKAEIASMNGDDSEDRAMNLIFITDGEPTALYPAAPYNFYSGGGGHSDDYGAIHSFNNNISSQLNVDNFYGMYIDSGSDGLASVLQNMKNKITATDENYIVMAKSSTDIDNALARFAAKMSPVLNNTTIYDEISSYATYKGNLKVTKKTGSNPVSTLVLGVDYQMENLGNPGAVGIKLLGGTTGDTVYTLSFDITPSGGAVSYFNLHGSYPDIGDAGTDFQTNTTSSGQPGFYSNGNAKLSYTVGGSPIDQVYNKPVIQVVMPEATEENITAYKNLTGKTLEADEFEFELYTKDLLGNKTVIETKKNDADGKIEFSPISYMDVGTYEYYIKEITGSDPSITYDNTEYKVMADVTFDGANLNVDFTYPTGHTFTNVYSATPVTVTLEPTKTLNGKTLTAGAFDFILSDSITPNIETVSNAADGSITFTPITFTAPGVYTYKIKEDASSPAANTVYDTVTRTVTITVTDGGGALTAAVAYTPNDNFVNTYIPPEIHKTISLKKILTGMKLSAGQFTFELTDPTGATSITAMNDADGNINYDVIFDAAGTYNYTVKEVIPQSTDPTFNEYMDYDNTILNVKVVVTSGGGGLSATVSYPDGDTFYNKYNFLGTIK